MRPAAHSASPRSAPSRAALLVALVLSLLGLLPAGPGPSSRARTPSVVAAANAAAPLAVELLHRRGVVERLRADGGAGGPDAHPPPFVLPPVSELAAPDLGREAAAPPRAAEERPRLRARSHVSARGPPQPGRAPLV